MNPYENDFADFRDPGDEQAELDAEHFSPCGCGDARCLIDGNDATNVNVNGTWFAADCCGLCWFCGHADDLRNLTELPGSRFAHDGCAALDASITEGRMRELAQDEFRDDFNIERR